VVSSWNYTRAVFGVLLLLLLLLALILLSSPCSLTPPTTLLLLLLLPLLLLPHSVLLADSIHTLATLISNGPKSASHTPKTQEEEEEGEASSKQRLPRGHIEENHCVVVVVVGGW